MSAQDVICYRTLIEATRPFTVEDRARSWKLTLSTLLLAGLALGMAAGDFPMFLRIPMSLLAGVIMTRVFVIYHDYEHGAIFRGSPVGSWLMASVGILFLRPPAEWRRSHNFHHQNNARLSTASVGSFPLKTLKQWTQEMTPGQRLGYRVIRHPLVIVFAYITVFVLEAFKKLFFPGWSLRLQSALAIAIHATILALAVRSGWDTLLLGVIIPYIVASAFGAYLFYVQHNFEGALFKSEEEWDYGFAALKSSSCLRGGPLLHWFTANIGYHHIHHLNHKIPFYRLPEAMAALPQLQKPVFVTLSLSDIRKSLSLKLWDSDAQQMVGYPA
jgi:omega-6 fatty acid desaturase (delta-12 desaturase)